MDTKYDIVIVGGGTAGWMTAAYLSKALGPQVTICVIESANVGTIGVGEATFSDIHLFFNFLELLESEWMPQCNAAYKLAIKFENWNVSKRHFYHPFQRFDLVEGRSIIEWWLKTNSDQPFDYTCYTVPTICDAKRSPRYLDGRVYDDKVEAELMQDRRSQRVLLMDDLQIQYPYAYHFDAGLLAHYLSKYATKRGVLHVLDDVVNVRLSETGDIRGVDTKDHREINGDLFIDCSGFRGLLINQALKEPFISFNESLPCDSAIAMQVPSDTEREGIKPYTTATALSAGWVWDIPLFHRVGTGYVYSSAFLSADAAEREFRQHLGACAERSNARHIKMRVGRNRNSWVKNCVAIGLSSGFVEPLESTGIFFIQHGIEQLVNHLPFRSRNEESTTSYNKLIAECIDGVREFLTLHYVGSTRSDTCFWKATKTELLIPDELRERLRLWKHRLPTRRTIYPKFHGFSAYSYCVLWLGLGNQPETHLSVLDYMDARAAQDAFDKIRKRSEQLVANLPPQYDYLSLQAGVEHPVTMYAD